MIQQLKDRWKGYKEKRFLETYGCKTWREYERKFDPDYGPRARYVINAYHGYPHVWPHPNGDSPTHHDFILGWRTSNDMVAWCEKNCQGKWRNDWHRVFWDTTYNMYAINEMGGADIMFFAFKEESDFMWFTLVWG